MLKPSSRCKDDPVRVYWRKQLHQRRCEGEEASTDSDTIVRDWLGRVQEVSEDQKKINNDLSDCASPLAQTAVLALQPLRPSQLNTLNITTHHTTSGKPPTSRKRKAQSTEVGESKPRRSARLCKSISKLPDSTIPSPYTGIMAPKKDKHEMVLRGRPSSQEEVVSDPIRKVELGPHAARAGKSKARSPVKEASKTASSASRHLSKRESMVLLHPAVSFFPLSRIKHPDVSATTRSLFQEMVSGSATPAIPIGIKKLLPPATPMKTAAIPDHLFTPTAAFEEADFPHILRTIQDVVDSASEVRRRGAPESQLISTVIMPLLNLVCRLANFQEDKKQVQHFDLTSTSIRPSSLCSYADNAEYKDLDKKIDAALGLRLDYDDEELLQRGQYKGFDSINQTDHYVNFVPMFLNIEVKRQYQDVDPLIQLGAWIAAEFEKRRLESYPLDMPTMAVEIDGDLWRLYVVCAVELTPERGDEEEPGVEKKDYKLQFIGHIAMGMTDNIAGTFQILDSLHRCVEWGVGPFRKWFEENVMALYRPNWRSTS